MTNLRKKQGQLAAPREPYPRGEVGDNRCMKQGGGILHARISKRLQIGREDG